MSPFSAFCFSLLLLGFPGGVKAAAPDLTVVDLSTINTTANYNLGPTGMRGWIYAASPGGYLASQGTTTSWQPWQILVTTVGTNTPASGIMASNDVILGVSAGAASLPVPSFTNDSRKSLGWAIGAAEASDGKLNLKRWRGGVTTDVTLQLQVLGAYSATAPYNCPKSAVILSNASVIIGSRSFNAGVPGDPVLGLALLATGDANHLAKAQTYAYSIAPATLALRFAPGQDTSGSGLWVWGHGYKLVFLAEYYLRTGDTNVLHGINEYAVALAQAQSRYGTMAHGGANLNADGSFHGTVGGYGPVNSGGLVANLGIVLAKKCLVAAGRAVDPEIDPAIGRAAKFFGWYVQKGNIPYGEHEPWYYHAGNGKEYLSALMFAMMGDQPVATEYWTRMSVAGYNGQQYGHTGQGFSYVWSGMGVNVGGTNAMAAYMAQTQWYMDLERRWDGSFVYDGAEQFGGSAVTNYWTVGGNNDYSGIDPTASWVLTYALPKQQLYLTGRNANPTNWLSSDKVTNAIWAGVYDQLVAGYNTNQLMSALGEYDPLVRGWAATQLGGMSAAAPLFPALTNLVAASTNPWVRSAACTALGAMGNTTAVRVLVQALRDPDNWVRNQAAKALWPFSAATVSLNLTNIMMAFTNNATDPNVINWSDPVQIANGMLANEIFGYGVNNPTPNNLGSKLTNAPADLYYATVRTGLRIPDSATRQCGANYAKNLLSLAGVKAVLPDLMACAAEMTQADTMWCGGCRAAAIQTLGKYQVAEALPLALSMLNVPPGDGSGSFGWNCDSWQVPAMSVLTTYGDAARWTLPSLNDYLDTGWGYGIPSGTFTAVQSAIAGISSAVTTPATMTNLFPVASAQVVVTTNAKAITLTGFSWRTNTVAFTNVTAPAHGTLSGTAPNLTYTPANGYTGMDRFTFQVRDSFTNSDPATVSLIVGTPPGTGLKGEYYDNANFTNLKFTRTDPQVNFDWGTGSPSNSMAADTFSVRWTGLLLAPETGNYTFSTLNSDGVRFYVNGVLAIDDFVAQSTGWTDGTPIALTAGQQYELAMDYYENTGSAVARLKWTGPSFAGSNGVIIAQSWLYDGAGVTNRTPFAYPQTVTMVQNTNQAITLTGSGGSNVTYAIATLPAHGSLAGTPPAVTYSPATNYTGTDSFTFYVNNGLSNSAPAMVSIAIWAGAPVAFTWKSAVSSNWSVAGNWTSGAPAPAGEAFYTLNFTPSGTYTVTNDLNDGFLLNQLNVAGAVTFAGANSLAFTANGPILPQLNQNSASAVTFDMPLTLSAMTTLGGTGDGAVTMPAPISGAGGLIKNAYGTLNLNYGTNTYSGGTTINAGTVAFPAYSANTTALLGTGPVTFNSGATLALNRTALANSVTLNNATVTAGNSFGSTLSGPVTLSGISTISVSGSLTIAGNISGAGGLTKTLGSTVPVTGSNTYTGPTTISAGALKFKSSLYGNDTAQWTPANITVDSGAALILNIGGAGEFTPAQFVTLFGNLTTNLNNNGLQAGSVIGVDTGTAGGTYTVSATLADSTGPGGGAVGLKHFGAGTLELTGANTYSGVSITDNNGTLKVSSLNSINGGFPPLPSSSLGRPTTIANGTIWLGQTTFQGGNLTYTGAGETTDRVLNLDGGGNETYRLDQSGSGLLKFTSNMTMTDTRGPKTIVLQGSTAGTGEMAGVIPNATTSTPTLALTKSGTGTWTLSGANSYAGVTTVSGGCLVLSNATALPGGLGTAGGLSALTFNGGVVGLGAGDFTRNLAAAGTVTGVNFTGHGGWAAYGADCVVNLGNASAPITWATAATGLNARTLILGNATATHTVDFQNPLDLGTAARTVQVDNGAAALDGKLSGSITGGAGGNLTKTGSGTLALSGVNNYAGTTTVSAGTLLVNGTNSGTGLITVASGATNGGTGTIAGAVTYSSGAKALFTVTPAAGGGSNSTLLTITGVMTCNATEVHLNLPTNLVTGTYTLAASSATAVTNGSFPTPVVDSGSFVSTYTNASIALDGTRKKLVLTVTGVFTPPAPTVDNAAGATNLSPGVAQLRGTLANGPADVRLYWGTTDGGTNQGNWANTNLLTGAGSGSFSTNVSNLLYGLTYYYRGYASNQWGTAWASATTNFTTLRPASSLANSAASGITPVSATLNATLDCTGAIYDVVAYWNTINGGTNTVLWTNSAYVGTWTNTAAASLSHTAPGLTPSTTFYFTLRATNAVDSLWATNVQSFTTLVQPTPPVPVLPPDGVVMIGAVPSFTFTAAAGVKYRLDYKNLLTDSVWSFGNWVTNTTGSAQPMTLTDPSAVGQPQRFYRLEAAYP